MVTARHETWPIDVIVEREAECRFVPNEFRLGGHLELETGGEYRIDLGAVPWEEIARDACPVNCHVDGRDFHVAARVEDGELVLSLAYRPVEQLEPPPESELLACPGCGGLVRPYVFKGKLPCPICGWKKEEV